MRFFCSDNGISASLTSDHPGTICITFLLGQAPLWKPTETLVITYSDILENPVPCSIEHIHPALSRTQNALVLGPNDKFRTPWSLNGTCWHYHTFLISKLMVLAESTFPFPSGTNPTSHFSLPVFCATLPPLILKYPCLLLHWESWGPQGDTINTPFLIYMPHVYLSSPGMRIRGVSPSLSRSSLPMF